MQEVSRPATPAPPVLQPLSQEESLIRIEPASSSSDAMAPSWLAVPLGTTRPRPVVIVEQSVQLDAAQFCKSLSELTQANSFMVCQYHSRPASAGTSGSPQAGSTERQLRHALKFTKQRFGPYVGGGGAVLVAVHESSRFTETLVRQEPGFFARVLSLSQRFEWSSSGATSFGRAGGKRILLSSARADDMNSMLHRSSLFKRAGAEAAVVGYEGAWAPEPVLEFVGQHWTWLIAEDNRFERQPKGAR